MIISKKMRDGSFIELIVDEGQAAFLLKHDPVKYTIDTKKNKKEFKFDPEKKTMESKDIPEIVIENVEEEEIPDLIDEV